MTEEEKQAIETVKQYKKCFVFETVHEETGERLNDYSNAIDIVLNLIEKQQREIEEMREELQMYVDTNLMKEKLEREIEKLKGIHKEFLKLHQELKAEDTFLSADNIIKAIRKNYISKYKIRELIKEIEKNELMQKLDFGQIKFTLKVLNGLLEE